MDYNDLGEVFEELFSEFADTDCEDTREAIEQSIEKWERMRNIVGLLFEYTTGQHCPLCCFLEGECDVCPLDSCESGKWSKVREALVKLDDAIIALHDQLTAALKAEIEDEERLRKKLKREKRIIKKKGDC